MNQTRGRFLTYGSRGNVEPMVALAVQPRALSAEVRVCAPADFAELLAPRGGPTGLVLAGERPFARGN